MQNCAYFLEISTVMMRLLSVVYLFLFPIVLNAATFQHAQIIYNEIATANNISVPPLVLSKSSEVNADETPQRISINEGMLRFVKNDSELALILGHEMGHFYLHHGYSSIEHEFAADYQGGIFMSYTGYDICTGAQIFKRMYQGPSSDHPRAADRIIHLGCH